MESYREKQKRQQISLLKMVQDEDRLIVRPPRYGLGFVLGLLVAVAVFFAGTLPEIVPRPKSSVPKSRSKTMRGFVSGGSGAGEGVYELGVFRRL